MSCWLRKYKPRAAFWSLSAVLFCQAEAFLSSDTKCLLSFSPWDPRTLPPTAAPAFVSPRERAAGRTPESLAGTPHSAQPRSSPRTACKGLPRAALGNSGQQAGTSEGGQNKCGHLTISDSLQRAPSHSRTKGPARDGLEL